MASSSSAHNLPSPLTPLPSPPHASLEARLATPSSLSGSGKAPASIDSDHLDSSSGSDDNMDADSDDPKESNLFVAETSRAHGGKSTRVLRTRDAAAPSEWGKQGRGTRAGAGRGAVGKGFGGVGGLMETGFVQPDKILDKEYSGRLNFDPFAEQLDLELGAPTAAPTTA